MFCGAARGAQSHGNPGGSTRDTGLNGEPDVSRGRYATMSVGAIAEARLMLIFSIT
ncbi:hypothetical protein E1H18_2659 [Caulobacter sp. RHG1]|nr:hypothetical protein [Caulobacter sp. RHG1]